MIPDIVHMNFGMTQDFGGKPFGLIHYLAVKSVARFHPVEFIYGYEPNSYWWAKVRRLKNVRFFHRPYNELFGIPAIHPSHRSDIIRLNMLYYLGGIYVDCDVITLKPYADLFGYKAVMAQQYGHGLCNAVMLAERGNTFIGAWIDEYSTFDNNQWDYHSVILPAKLSERFDVHVLPSEAFFPFNCNPQDIADFLTHDKGLAANSYCFHLWEQNGWSRLQEETVDTVWTSKSEFASYARELLL